LGFLRLRGKKIKNKMSQQLDNINPVIILGAKGLGKSALEIFKQNKVVVYGFLDEDKMLHNTEIDFVPILGSPEDEGFLKLIGNKCDAFVSYDDNTVRRFFTRLLLENRKIQPINAIHQKAIVSSTAQFGYGNFINAGAIIGANVLFDNHTIINSGVIIEYEAKIGNFVQLGAKAIIGAEAIIEENAFIGAGAIVAGGIKIGKNARVGAGSLVIANVKDNTTVFGNPAQVVK
jgi:sugar O-acyltransferase (sialic acid O-acetyltransferase NeuD family)